MDEFIGTLLRVAILLVFSAVVAIATRDVRIKWLGVALAVVIVNDALLTRFFWQLPAVFSGDWNWTGKVFALAGTLALAALPAFGFTRSGITLRQAPGSRPAWYVLAALSAMFFLAGILTGDGKPENLETIAFQWTMPGLEEELFYRGVLLLALNEAFPSRRRIAGTELGWGALLTSLLFGLVHGVDYTSTGVEWALTAFATTFIGALVLVWMREKTGSVLAPVLGHNVGNGAFTLF